MIRVEVINHDQPNSRWYSGTGIYRPVWLYIVPKKHLRFDSVKITTLDYKEPKIRVEAWPNAAGEVKVEIMEKQIVTRKAVAGESADQTDETIEQCIDENAVQPTVQNSDKASDKIIALEILQADGKFSREIALPGANLESGSTESLHLSRNLRRGYSGRNLWNPCSKLYSGRGLLYQWKTCPVKRWLYPSR